MGAPASDAAAIQAVRDAAAAFERALNAAGALNITVQAQVRPVDTQTIGGAVKTYAVDLQFARVERLG